MAQRSSVGIYGADKWVVSSSTFDDSWTFEGASCFKLKSGQHTLYHTVCMSVCLYATLDASQYANLPSSLHTRLYFMHIYGGFAMPSPPNFSLTISPSLASFKQIRFIPHYSSFCPGVALHTFLQFAQFSNLLEPCVFEHMHSMKLAQKATGWSLPKRQPDKAVR